MCLGMQARGVQGNQDILTFAGSKDPCYKDRRREASCTGCCSGIVKDSGPFQGLPTSCDEYPFASTVEGGQNAHRSCVVAFQNSLQGGRLSAFYSNLQYGQQFVVRVVGISCASVRESDLQGCGGANRKRQDQDLNFDDGLLSGTEDQVRAIGDNSTQATVISFGDLRTGEYVSRLRLLAGQADRAVILSNSGNELVSGVSMADLAGTGTSLDFELDSDEFESGVGALVYTSERSINVSYIFEAKAASASSIPTGMGALSKPAWTARIYLSLVMATIFGSL